jgi:hypothetical protein
MSSERMLIPSTSAVFLPFWSSPETHHRDRVELVFPAVTDGKNRRIRRTPVAPAHPATTSRTPTPRRPFQTSSCARASARTRSSSTPVSTRAPTKLRWAIVEFRPARHHRLRHRARLISLFPLVSAHPFLSTVTDDFAHAHNLSNTPWTPVAPHCLSRTQSSTAIKHTSSPSSSACRPHLPLRFGPPELCRRPRPEPELAADDQTLTPLVSRPSPSFMSIGSRSHGRD